MLICAIFFYFCIKQRKKLADSALCSVIRTGKVKKKKTYFQLINDRQNSLKGEDKQKKREEELKSTRI